MDGIGLRQPHMAIDATARVPARIRLVRIIHPDSHHVLTLLHIRCDIILKTRIAIRPEAHLLTIHIYRRVHVNTVEFEEAFLAASRQREMLPVPSDSPWQGTTACATGVSHIEVALDGPVVGHVEQSPTCIVIVRLRHLGTVSQYKPPALVEVHSFSRLHRRSHEQRNHCQ